MQKGKIKGQAYTFPSYGNSFPYTTKEKEILTVEEVAKYTGYSKAYIYKLCHERKIPHYNNKFGRRLFFLLDEIIDWCTANKIKTITEILKIT